MANQLFSFENLEVWQISLEVGDIVYSITNLLPEKERYNLISQMERAANSISLNIAEGSVFTSDREKIKFLNTAIRSCIEVVAAGKIIMRRKYLNEDNELVVSLFEILNKLFAKLSAFISTIRKRLNN